MFQSGGNSFAKRLGALSVVLLVFILVAGCAHDDGSQAGDLAEKAPPSVTAVRDAVLSHVSEEYAVLLPMPEAQWVAEWAAPGDATGAGAFDFRSAGCTVTVAYPVSAPEAAIYHVRLDDQTSGIHWQGAINASGEIVTTLLAPPLDVPSAAPPANLGVGGISPDAATTPEQAPEESAPPAPQVEIRVQPAAPRNLTPHALATASSVLLADGQGSYDAGAVIDGFLGQPWQEGVAGPGIGEWIMLEFPWPAQIDNLAIAVGYDRDDESFAAHHRVHRATLVFDDGQELMVRFVDRRGLQNLPLFRLAGEPIETSSIKLIIEDVYRGESSDSTAIGEIQVWGTASQ